MLGQIELEISKAHFETWVKNTSIHDIQDGRVLVAVPSIFSKEWIENKYHKLILRYLKEEQSDIRSVDYVIKNDALKQPKPQVKKFFPMESLYQESIADYQVDTETNLNPKYQFENFIVGDHNEIAVAAAKAVANHPGIKYNPLYVYGSVGLGKTHILQGIGNSIKKNFPAKKIKYVTAEKFLNELVTAIQHQTMEDFKARFRPLDVIIIDDVQFFANKNKGQDELFHTFNTLYERNKQIVFSSDKPPAMIDNLEERLRSRFEGGVIMDIGYPNFETRMAILKSKCEQKKVVVSDKILEMIAFKITKNIRELEGALNRVFAQLELRNNQTSEKEMEDAIKTVTSRPAKIINFSQIVRAVADFYGIPDRDILNRSRKKEVVKPRQIAIYLIRKELQMSFPSIGEKLGGRDHTTAMHSYEKINKNILLDEILHQEIETIKSRIKSA